MNVSVIIPTYNNEHTIGSVLKALKNQEYDKGQVDVIVIDDGSKDSTVRICGAHGVNVVCNERNSGLAYTLNKGIRLSNHEIVVTLHGDTIPLSTKLLSKLVKPLGKSCFAASCSLQSPPRLERDNLSLWEKLLWAKLEEHNALNNKADAYRKTALSEIGLFDDKTFRTAGEDEDIAFRLREANKGIAATKARVRHDHHFSGASGVHSLLRILKKEYVFGQAGGALRRKFPFHKPGSYVYPRPKSFVADGSFRTMVCIGCFLPYIQVVCIPLLFSTSFLGVTKTVKLAGTQKAVLLYPLLNIMRFWFYTLGYCLGIIRGKQT